MILYDPSAETLGHDPNLGGDPVLKQDLRWLFDRAHASRESAPQSPNKESEGPGFDFVIGRSNLACRALHGLTRGHLAAMETSNE